MLGEILTTLNIGEKVWKSIGTFRETKPVQVRLK
jgi:hypothetical protein